MNRGKTLFAQLMDFLPWSTFTRIVGRYGGDHGVRKLSCAEHYRAMAFAQKTVTAKNGDSALIPLTLRLRTQCQRCWVKRHVICRHIERCLA